MTNKRDCEHGSQIGKCDTCDLFEAYDEIETLRTQLAKANERVRELKVQLKRLIDYEADQALLPEASSQGTRKLVNDIKNDATDVGGCYEVSCGLLDSLFEHYTDKGASKLLNKFAIEKKQEAILTIKDKWIKKASEMPPQLECRSKGSSCYNWAMFYARELTDEAEQLRKEQE